MDDENNDNKIKEEEIKREEPQSDVETQLTDESKENIEEKPIIPENEGSDSYLELRAALRSTDQSLKENFPFQKKVHLLQKKHYALCGLGKQFEQIPPYIVQPDLGVCVLCP